MRIEKLWLPVIAYDCLWVPMGAYGCLMPMIAYASWLARTNLTFKNNHLNLSQTVFNVNFRNKFRKKKLPFSVIRQMR